MSVTADCQQEEFPIGLDLVYSHEEYDLNDTLVQHHYYSYLVEEWVGINAVIVEIETDFEPSYQTTLDFPGHFLNLYESAQLWIDTSITDMRIGQFITMDAFTYQIVHDNYLWSGPTGPYDCYHLNYTHSTQDQFLFTRDLYYDMETGILIEYQERMWNTGNPDIGYTNTSTLVDHNFYDFTAFELVLPTMTSIIDTYSGFLLVGIVVEVLIIILLVKLRDTSKE